MLALILFCNILTLATVCLCCYIIYKKKPVTKITFEPKESGVYLMDAKHEKAIQDKMEVDE